MVARRERQARQSAQLAERFKRSIKYYKLLVLDFDQTLISAHSGGFPITNKTETKLEPLELDHIEQFLSAISKHTTIAICTRGVVREVTAFVRNVGWSSYITEIVGALTPAEVNETYIGEWADKKAALLDSLTEKYAEGNKDHVIFFDDTKANTDAARRSGYVHSMNNRTSGSQLLRTIYASIRDPAMNFEY